MTLLHLSPFVALFGHAAIGEFESASGVKRKLGLDTRRTAFGAKRTFGRTQTSVKCQWRKSTTPSAFKRNFREEIARFSLGAGPDARSCPSFQSGKPTSRRAAASLSRSWGGRSGKTSNARVLQKPGSSFNNSRIAVRASA
jgi:hypothetical protein